MKEITKETNKNFSILSIIFLVLGCVFGVASIETYVFDIVNFFDFAIFLFIIFIVLTLIFFILFSYKRCKDVSKSKKTTFIICLIIFSLIASIFIFLLNISQIFSYLFFNNSSISIVVSDYVIFAITEFLIIVSNCVLLIFVSKSR